GRAPRNLAPRGAAHFVSPLRWLAGPLPKGGGAMTLPLADSQFLPATNGDHGPASLPLLLSLAQAASPLGLSERTLKRAAAHGALPKGAVCRPFGRRRLFSRLVLEEWCSQGCPRIVPRSGRRA